MRTEPRAWHSLMGKISKVVSDLLVEQVRAGVQAVQVFDSWVGVLSPFLITPPMCTPTAGMFFSICRRAFPRFISGRSRGLCSNK